MMLGKIVIILKVLCIVQQIHQGQGLVADRKDVAKAEVVYPERIHATRKKDDLSTEVKTGQHEDTLNIRIPTKHEGDLHLKLKKREVGPSRLLLRTYDEEGAPMHKWHDQPNCFYTGEVKDKRESNVHVSTCDAIVNGYVEFDSKKYELQSHDDQKGSHKLIPVEDSIGHVKDFVKKDNLVQMDEKEIKMKSTNMEKDLNMVKIFDKESIQETKKWNSMFITEKDKKPESVTDPNTHAVGDSQTSTDQKDEGSIDILFTQPVIEDAQTDDLVAQNNLVSDEWKSLFTTEIEKDTLGETDRDTDEMTSQQSDDQDSKKKDGEGNTNPLSSVSVEDVVEEDDILLDDLEVVADEQNLPKYDVKTSGKCKSVNGHTCYAISRKIARGPRGWSPVRSIWQPPGCFMQNGRNGRKYVLYNSYPRPRRGCSSHYKCICAPHPCEVNNGGCAGTCVRRGDAAACTCGEGLMVAQDGKNCEPLPPALESNDACCKVIDIDLQGSARTKQPSLVGRYVRYEVPINGRYYYVKTDGKVAIWYLPQIKGWTIANIDVLGQPQARLADFGGESAFCPHERRLTSWKYWSGTAWISASRVDFKMDCRGIETAPPSENRGFCQDKQVQVACNLHGNGGFCESHRITLDKYCRKTCGLCTAAGPYCEDRPFPGQSAENCAFVVEKGLCISDRPLAERYCKKSCGLCTGNEPSKPVTTSANYLYSEGVASQSNGYCSTPVTKEMCATMYPSTGPMVVMDPTHQTWPFRGITPPGCFLYQDLVRKPHMVRKVYWNTYSESMATCKDNVQCICIKFSVSAITASSVDGQHLPKNAIASTIAGFFMSQAENRPWLKAELVDRNPLELSTINSIDIIMRDDSNGKQFKNVEIRAGSSPDIAGNEVVGIFRGPGKTGGVARVQLMKSLAFSNSDQDTKFNVNNPRFLIFQMQGDGVLAVKGFMEHFNQAPRSRVRCQGQSAGECCTSTNPCDVSQGQCNDDSQCKGDLKCGQNNCHWGQGRCCQPQQATGKQYLSRGGVLLKGTELTSPNGQYHLRMGYDGHLVLRKDGQAADVWKSTKDDDGRPGDDGLFFATSGYLYIPYHYDSFRFKGSEPIHVWDSRNQLELKIAVNQMELKDDGNLVIFKKVGIMQMKEIWSSKHGMTTSRSLKLLDTVPESFARGLSYQAPADIASKYRPYMSANQISQTRYLELFVSVEFELLKARFGNSANRAVREVLNHMFRVDQVFAKINIRIVVSAMEVNGFGPSYQRHFHDIRKEYDAFKEHVAKLKREDVNFKDVPIDDSLFLTKEGWPQASGMAGMSQICQEKGAAIAKFGMVPLTAHELGHNFGFYHIKTWPKVWLPYIKMERCTCLGTKNWRGYTSCLMEPSPSGYDFTDCDIKVLDWIYKNPNHYTTFECLNNIPKNLAPKCGNGILEPGEGCDCGTTAQCTRKDPCCVATTCRKKTTAQCAQ